MHTPAMHLAKVLILSGTAALLVIPALLFFVRAFPQRRTCPEVWQNGLCFVLPFLTFGLTWIFTLAIAPVALVAAIVTAFIPLPKAKRIMWLSLGELAATVIGTTTLGLLNTYAMPQR